MSNNVEWLDAPQLRKRYGNKSNTTIQRWLSDAGLQFPKPVVIREERYWRVDELDKFDARMAAQGILLRRHARAAENLEQEPVARGATPPGEAA